MLRCGTQVAVWLQVPLHNITLSSCRAGSIIAEIYVTKPLEQELSFLQELATTGIEGEFMAGCPVISVQSRITTSAAPQRASPPEDPAVANAVALAVAAVAAQASDNDARPEVPEMQPSAEVDAAMDRARAAIGRPAPRVWWMDRIEGSLQLLTLFRASPPMDDPEVPDLKEEKEEGGSYSESGSESYSEEEEGILGEGQEGHVDGLEHEFMIPDGVRRNNPAEEGSMGLEAARQAQVPRTRLICMCVCAVFGRQVYEELVVYVRS